MEHHFDIDIAKEYGIAEAVLINHFQFWIAKNKANMVNFHDGKFWTYNTKSAIQELFPYLSYDQVRRALERLVEKGVLVTGNYNKIPTDRTLWYSFTDEFEVYLQRCQMQEANLPNAKSKTAQQPYNSTTYNTPNTLFPLSDDKVNKDISPTLELYRFDEFWDAYDKKCGRDRAERAWKKLSKAEVDAAIAYIPSYKAAQPNKMYRKNPEAYINQRAWNDELIGGNDGIPPRPAKGNWVWSEDSKKWIPVV